MAAKLPAARDSVLVFADADGTEHVLSIGSPEWYSWLADEEHRSFVFASPDGSFQARKERKQRGGWYWIAYRRAQGKIHKRYLGKPEELNLARLHAAAAQLTQQSATPAAPPILVDPGASPTAQSLVPAPYILATKLFVPPLRPTVVARPRLMEQLQAGAQGRLTLLSAPAGFGKTTLLSAWLREIENAKLKIENDDSATSASQFSNAQRAPDYQFKVAWVSLDAGDTDPVQFWTYVVTALDQVYPGAGTAALAALQSPQPPPIEALLIPLLNALSSMPHDAVLILDDYHVIGAPPIHQALSFLVERLPPRLHLVIATRSDPPLPLTRLRARGELTELRATDLRFSVAETAAFLMDSMGLPLTTHDVAALETRTEGWIAGLQLAAIAMRDRGNLPGFINAFTGSNRFVMDYLASEVLERLPAHLQTFVFQTAILDRLCGPLCDAVLGIENEKLKIENMAISHDHSQFSIFNSQLLLEELDRTNLFIVPLDDERTWYRYHHLFAEVAQARLRTGAGEIAIATLHRRASAWFEDAGFVAEAVRHALAAHDWERAARLIEHSGYVGIVRGQLQTVRGWLNTLPDDLVRNRAWLGILHAITLLFTNQIDVAEARLRDAEQQIENEKLSMEQVDLMSSNDQFSIARRAPDSQFSILLGHIYTIRGAIVHFSGNLAESVALAARALDLLPETEVLSRPLALVLAAHAYRVSGDVTPTTERAATSSIELVRGAGNLLAYLGALLNLAELQVVQGRLQQAAAHYREAAHVALGSGGLPVLVGSPAYSFGMADLLREWNDLTGAEQHLAQGMELIQGALTVHADVMALGYLTCAQLQHARGDSAGARATLATFADLARRRHFDDLVLARGSAAQARIALMHGDLPAAVQWMLDRGIRASDDLSYVREAEYLTLARVLIAQGRSDSAGGSIRDALRLLERLRRAVEAGGRTGAVIEARMLQALALDAQGDRHAALTTLAEALTLAAPEGYVRLFVDEGVPMAELLRAARARGIASDYVARLLAAFGELKIENEEVRRGAAQAHSQFSILNSQFLVEPLTAREHEVLRLVADGASNGEIAEQLVIAVGTVKRHINNLFSKLGAQSRTQAIRAARDLNLL